MEVLPVLTRVRRDFVNPQYLRVVLNVICEVSRVRLNAWGDQEMK